LSAYNFSDLNLYSSVTYVTGVITDVNCDLLKQMHYFMSISSFEDKDEQFNNKS